MPHQKRMTAVRAIRLLAVAAAFVVPSQALGQTAGQNEPPNAGGRPTGLPPRIEWTFNFDAGWGTFGFANSLFDNPKEPASSENLSDQWFEGYVKPALSASYTLASSSEIYGKVSVVGERTYGSVPELFGPDVSSFGPEDRVHRLAIGQVDRLERERCWISPSAARSTGSDTASCCATARPKAAAAAATGPTRARRSSSPRSGASSRARTRSKLLSRQGRARRERHAAPGCGARTTSVASASTRRSAPPT